MGGGGEGGYGGVNWYVGIWIDLEGSYFYLVKLHYLVTRVFSQP